MRPSRQPFSRIALPMSLLLLCVTACGDDYADEDAGVSDNDTANNASMDMGAPTNNTTIGPTADMSGNNTANNNSSGNNITSSGDMFGRGDMGQTSQTPPLDPMAPWPKFRANAEQTGRTTFTPSDDGRDLWSFQTEGSVWASPVVDVDERVYIGSGDGTMYALSDVGEPVWQFPTGAPIVASALLDDAGQVIFGSADGNLYALDRAAGGQNWSARADTPTMTPTRRWGAGPAMGGDGDVLVGNDNATLYKVDRLDGSVQQRVSLGGQVWGSVAIDIETGDFFIGDNEQDSSQPNIAAFAPQGLTERWSERTLGSVASSPMVLKDRVIVGSFDGFVRAYGKTIGDLLWEFPTRGHVTSSPALVGGDTIVAASADGTLYGLDAMTGTELWAFDWPTPLRSSPAVDAARNVYVGTQDGVLLVVNGMTGQLSWALDLAEQGSDALHSSPALGPHAIYIGSESGEVFAVPAGYCLRASQANNPQCITAPGEPAPTTGVDMLYTSRFGAPSGIAPQALDVHEGLTFSLRVRDMQDTVLALIDPSSLQVTLDPPINADVEVAPGRTFVTIVPVSEFDVDAMGEFDVTLRGDYLTDPMRTGLALTGGQVAGTFHETFTFGRTGDGAESSMYPFPDAPGRPAGVFAMHHLTVPLPTLLPSYERVDLDSADYLIGLIEGTGDEGIGWVVEAAPTGPMGALAPVPQTTGGFPVSARYEDGRWTFAATEGRGVGLRGTTTGFESLRLAAREDPTGSFSGPADLTLRMRCQDVPVYGDNLRDLGTCDTTSDVLLARGAALITPEGSGIATDPGLFTSASFTIDASGDLQVTVTESSIDADANYVAVALVDAATGEPISLDYGAATTLMVDASGEVVAAQVDLPTSLSGSMVRAHLIVGTYPAAQATLMVP